MKNLPLDRTSLQRDILAGITAAIVALPLALAFGVSSGLGAQAGLYGAIALGFFGSMLGGTRTQISGPTGPMTVVSATIIASFSDNTGTIVSIFLLAGLFQLLFGIMGVGKYVKFIPYSVISGFMSGIGVIIILLQLYPLIGLPTSSKALEVILQFPQALSKLNIQALSLASITIAVIYLFPKVTKQIPSTLVALLTGTLISVIFEMKVPLIGEIPQGLPDMHPPSFSPELFNLILLPSLTLAALGSLDSLLTSLVADKLTGERHQSNRELVGQGIGNSVSALIGGIPGAGATMRTVVNIQAGGTSRLSGIIHSLTLLIILLALGSYASLIPMPVLAGILITVGINIIDYRGFKDFRHIPRSDVMVTLTVLVLTVFVDLLQAVAIGMVLASILFVKRMGDLIANYTQANQFSIPWGKGGNILVKRFVGPFFFGFSSRFEEMIARVKIMEGKKLQAVIFDMSKVNYMDQSGLYTLEETLAKLNKHKVPLMIILPDGPVSDLIKKIKPSDPSPFYFVTSFEEAIDLLREKDESSDHLLFSSLNNYKTNDIPDKYRSSLIKIKNSLQ